MSSQANIFFKASEVSKYFTRDNYLFQNVNLDLKSGDFLGVSGKNGAGKSTLLKILASLMTPSSGSVDFIFDSEKLKEKQIPGKIAFVAPYSNLYEEFSPFEMAKIYFGMLSKPFDEEKLNFYLEEFSLENAKNKLIKNFSSGMKQRMKLVLALINNPAYLFLDEFTTNLDDDGKLVIFSHLKSRKKDNCITVIASNEAAELSLASEVLEIS